MCMKSVQRTAYWTVQGKKDCANYVWIYMSHDAFLFIFSLDISHDAFFSVFHLIFHIRDPVCSA